MSPTVPTRVDSFGALLFVMLVHVSATTLSRAARERERVRVREWEEVGREGGGVAD